MTYQPNIPLATDFISVSQQDINNNFTSLNNAFNTNHVTFNAGGAGKHKFCSFPDQLASPGTAVNEVAIYSKDVGGTSQLFFQREGLAPGGADIQMTVGNPTAAANGTSFLPGGIIIKWGSVVGAPGGNTATFATAFPNNVFSVTLGILDTTVARTATVSAIGLGSCLIKSSAVNTVYYIAIGN